MTKKILTTTALVAAIITSGVGQASADIGDAIAGGIIGGVIVGAIQRDRQRTRVVSGATSAARQLARDVQTALNHFYFHVGTPDGVMGRQSRAGVSQYQGYMGFPITGELAEFERQVLITAYQRAIYGGPQVTQVSQSHQDGLRGLLPLVRDEMLGVAPRTDTLAAAPAAPLVPAPETTSAGLPNLFGATPVQVSLASHCNRVSLISNANGGLTDINTMSDPVFTLNEQFCLARGHAIAEGEAILAQYPGISPQAVAEQCAGLSASLQSSIAAMSLQARDVVLAGVTQSVLNSGMSAADLATNARICLSNGYASDSLPVAIGSALILVALGETAYGELPAHHLMQGIGAAQRRDLASEWFTASVPAAGASLTTVGFQPGPAARGSLILAAVDGVNGVAAPVAPQPLVPQPVIPAASK